MTAKRYIAGHANYRGDQSSLLGQLRGPTTYNAIVIATSVDYDPATDRTRVEFSHATEADVAAVRG